MIDGFMALWSAANDQIKAIEGDPALSERGRAEKIAKLRGETRAIGERDLGPWLANLRRRAEAAEAAHSQARRRYNESRDHGRQAAALKRAEILASSSEWREIEAALAEARRLGDAYQLEAWRDLAPKVRARFPGNQDAGILGPQLEAELADLVPEDVREAAKAAEAAQVALSEAKDRLGTLAFAERLVGRDPAWIRDLVEEPAKIVTVETAEGGFYVTSTSGRLFG